MGREIRYFIRANRFAHVKNSHLQQIRLNYLIFTNYTTRDFQLTFWNAISVLDARLLWEWRGCPQANKTWQISILVDSHTPQGLYIHGPATMFGCCTWPQQAVTWRLEWVQQWTKFGSWFSLVIIWWNKHPEVRKLNVVTKSHTHTHTHTYCHLTFMAAGLHLVSCQILSANFERGTKCTGVLIGP